MGWLKQQPSNRVYRCGADWGATPLMSDVLCVETEKEGVWD